MARPQVSEVVISVITFGILANTACTAICFLFRRSRRTSWFNSCRLSLAFFLLLVVLWAYVNLTASLLDPASASSGSVCQVSVAFSVAIDQLARVALEQFLLWVIHDEWKASGLAVLVPQAFLLVRLALGGALVGTLRSQSDPKCVPQPPAPPLAAALLIADIAIIIYLFARAIAVGLLHHVFRRRPGSARGRPVLLVLVALAVWTTASAPRILANSDMGLVIRSIVPDAALLLVITAVVCFQNLLLLPQSKASFRRVDDDEANYADLSRRYRAVATDRGQPRDRNSIDSFYPPSLYGSIKGNMFRIKNTNLGQPQDYEAASLGFHRAMATREAAAAPPPSDLLPVLPAIKGCSWRWPNILDRFQRGPEQRSAGVRFKISHPIPHSTYTTKATAATVEPAGHENMVNVNAWNAVNPATSLPALFHHANDLEMGPDRPVAGRQRQQTVLFLNSIVYNDQVTVRNIHEVTTAKTRQSIELSRWLHRTTSAYPSLLLSLPKTTLLTGSAIMNLYRQYKRRSEADGWHSTNNNSTILTRCAPGSPTELPPLPPLPLIRPGRWGNPVRWLPNNTKSMTLDEKMDIFWLSFLPTGSSGIGQPRSSIETVDQRPFMARKTGPGVGEGVRVPSIFSCQNQFIVNSGGGGVGSDRDVALRATRSSMWMNVVDAPGENAGEMGGGELVMVMLVPGAEPLSTSSLSARRSRQRRSRQRRWSKHDGSAQVNWHRRVGEPCPSFSDRMEKQVISTGLRKMVPPRLHRFSVSPPPIEPEPAALASPHQAMAIVKALVQRIDQAVLSQKYGPGPEEEQSDSVDAKMEDEDDSDNDETGKGWEDGDRREVEEKSAQTAVLGRVTRATTIRLTTPRQTWGSTVSRGEGEAGARREARALVAAGIDSAAAYDPFQVEDLGRRDGEPTSNDRNEQAGIRGASEQLSSMAALRKPWTTGLKPVTSTTADLVRTAVTATTSASGQAQRPPRQSRQVSHLPDILESPKPLPDRRDTLGIFRFPWGQRSDSAVVPMGAAGWGRDLDRDRLVAPVEYVSFFDDYDDDEEEGVDEG